MRVLRLPAFLSILALLVIACGETKLEHFKFYEVTPGAQLASMEAIELSGRSTTAALRRGSSP